MQSFLQYRRLRREVQEDLARAQHAQQAQRPAGSALSTSTAEPKQKEPKEKEAKEEESREEERGEEEPKKVTLVPGVTVSRPDEGDGSVVFEVGWKENDPSDPLSWTLAKKWMVMLTCCTIAIPLTMLASIEGPTQDAFNAYYGVDAVAGSMTTGKT